MTRCFSISTNLTPRDRSLGRKNITTVLPLERRSYPVLHAAILQAWEFKVTTSGKVVLPMPLSSLGRLLRIIMTLIDSTHALSAVGIMNCFSSRPGYLQPTKCAICSKVNRSKRPSGAMIKPSHFSLQTKTPVSNAPHPRDDPSSLTKLP